MIKKVNLCFVVRPINWSRVVCFGCLQVSNFNVIMKEHSLIAVNLFKENCTKYSLIPKSVQSWPS